MRKRPRDRILSGFYWLAAVLGIFGVLVISTHLIIGVLSLIAAATLLSLREVTG